MARYREETNRDIIVVGASAGGVEALIELVGGLEPGLPAAVFIVLHLAPDSASLLPRILSRRGPLHAHHAQDGVVIQPGSIYVAPPDRHLLLERGRVRVTRGPRENGHRPGVDPLFRTAARAYGPRVTGVVVTGSGDDGAAGISVIKRNGGLAVVQDPDDAFSPRMPRAAIEHVAVDYIEPLRLLAPVLNRLVREPAGEWPAGMEPPPESGTMNDEALQLSSTSYAPGNGDSAILSGFTCPECGGRLWEAHEGEVLQFRCRVGHIYSADSLDTGKSSALEAALWAALNVMEENASLAKRLADDARERNHRLTALRFDRKAEELAQHAAMLRGALLTPNGHAEDSDELDEGPSPVVPRAQASHGGA